MRWIFRFISSIFNFWFDASAAVCATSLGLSTCLAAQDPSTLLNLFLPKLDSSSFISFSIKGFVFIQVRFSFFLWLCSLMLSRPFTQMLMNGLCSLDKYQFTNWMLIYPCFIVLITIFV